MKTEELQKLKNELLKNERQNTVYIGHHRQMIAEYTVENFMGLFLIAAIENEINLNGIVQLCLTGK